MGDVADALTERSRQVLALTLVLLLTAILCTLLPASPPDADERAAGSRPQTVHSIR